MPTRLVVGNWKMHGSAADFSELDLIIEGVDGSPSDTLLCVPAPLLAPFAARARGSVLAIGGQDCHPEPSGAYTGDIAAEMLAEAGARAVIVGHSERRTIYRETDALIRAKAHAAWRAGLTAVICLGESETERQAGDALAAITRQFNGSVPEDATPDRTVLAYEPIWAIGTGKIPSFGDIGEIHSLLRTLLKERFGSVATEFRILYGGSVSSANASKIFAIVDVDGGLVGGASLTANRFLPILAAAV